MTLYDKIAALGAKAGQSAWATRIVAELNFAAELSTVKEHRYDDLIDRVIGELTASAELEGGVITKSAAMKAEELYNADTLVFNRIHEQILAEMAEEAPVGRNGTPADVAKAFAYLAEAEFVTGQVIPVNGGYVI